MFSSKNFTFLQFLTTAECYESSLSGTFLPSTTCLDLLQGESTHVFYYQSQQHV